MRPWRPFSESPESTAMSWLRRAALAHRQLQGAVDLAQAASACIAQLGMVFTCSIYPSRLPWASTMPGQQDKHQASRAEIEAPRCAAASSPRASMAANDPAPRHTPFRIRVGAAGPAGPAHRGAPLRIRAFACLLVRNLLAAACFPLHRPLRRLRIATISLATASHSAQRRPSPCTPSSRRLKFFQVPGDAEAHRAKGAYIGRAFTDLA